MKYLKWSAVVVLYVLIGWGTALHWYQLDDADPKRDRFTSVVFGLTWPVSGLFIWSDVYLWEANTFEEK